MVRRLLSFWDGIFSRAMLNFQGVTHRTHLPETSTFEMTLLVQIMTLLEVYMFEQTTLQSELNLILTGLICQ